MFNLLTMLLLSHSDMPLRVAAQKGYCARFKYYDSYNNQDVVIRIYYDLTVNPNSVAQVAVLLGGVDVITLLEAQDIAAITAGATILATVTQR